MKLKIKKIILAFSASVFSVVAINFSVFADSEFSVSPMNQVIVLTPGETYKGEFKIVNPISPNNEAFKYNLSVGPFYMDANYEAKFENNGDYNQIVDWITLDKNAGVVKSNSTEIVKFQISVPTDAPAGGQYASIFVSSDNNETSAGALNIQSKMNIAHIIYAEIAGTTKRSGEISTEASVPGLVFSGNIGGTSTIVNTGNVHSNAHYTLQVFPLFSDEEVYTNEEKPESKIILPDRALMNTTYWDETPKVGVFKVIYTAEFEGVVSKTEKMVIVCPLWLLFVIIFGVILIVFWLFSKNKSRKKR